MKFLKYLLVSLLMCLPTFAQADTIVKPPGKSMWEMHVMGNGPVIASVLESVKLVIAPDAGGGGFRSLLVFMAILGFCILAIQAGFNPGQNIFKMFGYLFVVWVVSLTATQLKAHMLVMDPISRTETAVMNVPAVVAIPAAVVSGVGHYLTKSMQQAYSTANQDIALTDVGFDIFGKIQTDLDNFTITRPELQRSMAAYVSDCAVPAIAQKRMTSTELMTSPNLLGTLAQAQGDVFLTRYWAEAPSSAKPTSLGLESGIVTCTQAYKLISVDIEKHAQQMLDATAKEWTRSGVMVPYEQTLQTYVEAANIGKTAGGGTYGRPTGIITQKALINTMGGDFRQAAIQTGNNELLMGMQISQAEQSQKSGWVTSAAIFKNMMGYVYTTLQAFIFAIVPIVVVALMIPGLGKKIFVNYGQILVWLTLWEPMLSIVNYLVTLFRLEGVRNAVADSGGFTTMNTWVLSEGANNMVIAASFLGTMVPILTWGLVTGAMAFNEFISQGVGSSFAMTAGANAATGTSSLNNMNMNNVSNNGYSTAHKSTVGNQAVMAHENAGSLTHSSDHGGRETKKDGSAVSSQGSVSTSDVVAASKGLSASNTTTGSQGITSGKNAAQTESESTKAGRDFSQAVGKDSVVANTAGEQHSVGDSKSTSKSAKHDQSADTSDKTAITAQVGAAAGLGGGGGAAGGKGGGKGGLLSGLVKPSAGMTGSQTTDQSVKIGDSLSNGSSDSKKADNSTSTGKSATNSDSSSKKETVSNGKSHDKGSSNGSSAGSSNSVLNAKAVASTSGVTDTNSVSRSTTTSFAQTFTGDDYEAVQNLGGPADPRAARQSVAAAIDGANAGIESVQGQIISSANALSGAGQGPASFGLTGAAGPGANTAPLMNAAATTVATSTGLVNSAVAAQVGSSTEAIRGSVDGATSLITGPTGVQAGAGSNALAPDTGFDAKQAALGGGLAVSAVGSLIDFAGQSRAAMGASGFAGLGGGGAGAAGTAGGLTAGGLALGAAGVTAAGVGGWYAGRELVDLIGEERVGNALEPAFRAFDSATNNYFH